MEMRWEVIDCKNRARKGHSATPATDFGSQNHIDKLSDGLLIEILSRISSCESAIRCKCVSKRWLNLISNGFFTLQFLSHQHIRNSSKPLPFALIFDYYDREKQRQIFVYSQDHPAEFGSSRVSFNFLPHYRTEQGDQFVLGSVKATCGDLVLYSMPATRIPVEENPDFDFRSNYVICNPRTKQWVWLPPLRHSFNVRSKLALVCDPFYSFDPHGKCSLQESYSYRVISASFAGFELERPINVFSSETGQWSKLSVSCPEGLEGYFHLGAPPVVYNGMLHFLHSSNIMAFDPFVSEKDSGVACRVIDLPMTRIGLGRFYFLGTCSGCLRLSIGQRIDCAKFISVWDLEDYDKGEWFLKHQCSFDDLKVSCSTHLCKKFDDMDDIDILRVLGFHPYDKNILYLLFPRCVVVYNMRTRTSEAACEINLHTEFVANRTVCYANCEIHSLLLPWWPTPVAALA